MPRERALGAGGGGLGFGDDCQQGWQRAIVAKNTVAQGVPPVILWHHGQHRQGFATACSCRVLNIQV